MPRKSTRKNKTVYQLSREAASLTIERASELTTISESNISRIEGGDKYPQPDEILAMAAAYKDPALCNQYCSKQCVIGKEHVPEAKSYSLAQIVLEMLASLNSLNNQRDRLIEITSDDKIESAELKDFVQIKQELEDISVTVSSLKLWVENTILSGAIDGTQLEQIEKNL